MTDKPSLLSDFWWLLKNVTIEDLLVGVGHHQEVADNEDVPPLDDWYRSLDQEGYPSNDIQHYPINFLNKWRSAFKNTNVYRTLKVFDQKTKEATLLGPFLIDIDNSIGDNCYRENLNDAQAVTRQVVTYLVKRLRLSLQDFRIFFSGRKGFNVEIRPEAIGINGSVPDQIRLSSSKLNNLIDYLRSKNKVQNSRKNAVSNQGTVIDRIYGDRFNGYTLKHPCVRLHGSINRWIGGDGKAVARRKIEITPDQLWEMSAKAISDESEKLARIL